MFLSTYTNVSSDFSRRKNSEPVLNKSIYTAYTSAEQSRAKSLTVHKLNDLIQVP